MPHSGQSISAWMEDKKASKSDALTKDLETDVCIVGAGIAGLSVAYTLSKEGKSVIVLDDNAIGGGETERTTAHISNVLDDRFAHLEKLFGEEGSRMAAESHGAAIDRIEKIIKDESIDCDFSRVDDYLFAPKGDSFESMDEEFAASERAGLTVERLSTAPLPKGETGPCLKYANQAQFHPMKYLRGLAKAIEKNGGQIFTKAHVREIEGGDKAYAKTSDGHTVHAKFIVVATNSPINDRVTMHTKQSAYRSYVISAKIPKGSVMKALYWDTLDPYHYVRIQEETDFDLLIVGGEDHKTGQADDAELRYGRLEKWGRDHFPMMEGITHKWSGQVLEPVDGLAFIGRNPLDSDNVFIVTGDSGQGMTHCTIAGILIPDLILGRKNPWEALYDPSRKTAKALTEFAKENLNVAKEYMDLVTPGDVDSTDKIKPDSGAVLRRGITKIAIYRDRDGHTHEFSAVCPHLGCIVTWNSSEKSWDCPCHGSRYTKEGDVVNGPAFENLKPAE